MPGTVQPITFYIFIVLSVIVTNVVLLNLLISVISAMFARITDNQISANYQERAQMISENSYLVPRCSKRNFSVPQGYLIFAKRLLSKEDMRNMGDNSTEDDTTRK